MRLLPRGVTRVRDLARRSMTSCLPALNLNFGFAKSRGLSAEQGDQLIKRNRIQSIEYDL